MLCVESDDIKGGVMESAPAAVPATPQAQLIAAVLKLQTQHKSGATWFYWIAGLSVINSIVVLVGSQWSFIVGLGITQLVDGIALGVAQQASAQSGLILKIMGFIFDLLIAGLFVFFGAFATRRHMWAYVVGMVLYAFDGLIFLIVKDFLSIGFHIFALVCIYNGLQASIKLRALEEAVQAVPPSLPVANG
jgi:hypothetical protein